MKISSVLVRWVYDMFDALSLAVVGYFECIITCPFFVSLNYTIDDIKQLKIYQKDRIGLVGRNGSGKTSLLQIIAQEKVPDKGNINQHSSIELIPQLKRTNTTQSGGEVTQEYIQQALNSHAGLLLVDEPTTNLDTSHIEWVERSLKNWPGSIVVIS